MKPPFTRRSHGPFYFNLLLSFSFSTVLFQVLTYGVLFCTNKFAMRDMSVELRSIAKLAHVISSILLVIAAPWGKTISYTFGPLLPARISWFFFESPNLFWTCFCWLSGSQNSLPRSNSLLLVLFFLHYVQRAIFYPYRMSSNTTRMPVVVVIAAFCFTVVNG